MAVDRGVVFWDFDGTLAFREGLWRSALIGALDRVDADHRITSEQLRPGLRDGFPWHRPDASHLDLDTRHAWWQALEPLFLSAYQQAGVDPETARAAGRLVPTVYTDPQFWTVFDDARPALTELRTAGFRSIVLSNHVPELAALVDALGLADLLHGTLTSALIGYEKPNPAVFAHALRSAGAPKAAWMIGDNPIADVAGAEAAGIHGILVRSAQPGVEPMQLLEAVSVVTSSRF